MASKRPNDMEDTELRDRISALEAKIATLEASASTAGGSEADDEVDYGWLVDRGGGGGSSGVTLTGTDESELSSDEFTFASAEDSNVKVKLDEENNKIVIGVYWK